MARARPVFLVLAGFFACAAVFHAAALAHPPLGPGAPAWRHGVFVGINALCAAGFVRRPWFFVPAFGALAAQQLVSHGGDAWSAWRDAGRLDVASIAVVAVMPLALALLVVELWARRRGAADSA